MGKNYQTLGIHLLVAIEITLFNCFLILLYLRILTGKKQRQIKLQRLEKVRIWAFGLLVY